jgi:C1A family cysteine protease
MKVKVLYFVLVLFGICENISSAYNRKKKSREEIIEAKLTFESDKPLNLFKSSVNTVNIPAIDLTDPFDIPMLFQSDSNQSETNFDKWKKKYRFKYSSETVETRVKDRLLKKLNLMMEQNDAYEKGTESYALAIDGYSGLEEEEFNKLRTGLSPKNLKRIKKKLRLARKNNKLTKQAKNLQATSKPKSLSIINSPYYPPVQDQLICGSCWAFSAVTILNYQLNVLKGDRSSDLSVQQLLDCDTKNNGCNGGLPDVFFKSMVESGYGIVNAKDYPYLNSRWSCSQPFKNESFKIVQEEGKTEGGPTGWGTGTEDELLDMVIKYGAVVVAVSVQDNFSNYRKGIFNGCKKPYRLNHAVVLVGYGVQGGKKFWNVRNSWGSKWGENGHIRIQRGAGMCGINMYFTAGIANLTQSN